MIVFLLLSANQVKCFAVEAYMTKIFDKIEYADLSDPWEFNYSCNSRCNQACINQE